MKISRTVAYALQATLQLANSNSHGPIPCSKLAADGNMPERFLLQVLRSLVTHGILNSTRGVDGGYTLIRSLDDLSVLDVIEAIEGRLAPSLPDGDQLPEEVRQRLRRTLDDIICTARTQLASIKLAHLSVPAPGAD